jgi:short-subunit dehydrogenase
MMKVFQTTYGPWALVAGASEGLGAAFAESLASRGINLILVARREPQLLAFAVVLRDRYGVTVETHALDLAVPGAAESFIRDLHHDVGLLICNAAYSAVGLFQEVPLTQLQQILSVNTAAPLALTRELIPRLIKRGRGGVVLMSSLSGGQGSSNIATYAATKAFNTVLAEGLWQELGSQGIDVIASCAGAIRTPAYQSAQKGAEAPGILSAHTVAEETLGALGKTPTVIPGRLNKVVGFLMRRLLPRATAIRLMSKSTKELQ